MGLECITISRGARDVVVGCKGMMSSAPGEVRCVMRISQVEESREVRKSVICGLSATCMFLSVASGRTRRSMKVRSYCKPVGVRAEVVKEVPGRDLTG